MKLEDLNTSKSKAAKPKKARNLKHLKEGVPNSPTDSRIRIVNIALVVFILGFILCITSLIWYYMQAKASMQTVSKYAPSIVLNEDSVAALEQNKELTMVDVRGTWIWDRYVDAYLKNPDCIGWIQIPDTTIDYPVAHSVESPDYYLHRDLDKNYSFPGTIFADTDSNIETLSNNVTLYGHHMRNGSMFASLEKYEDDKYYKKHKTIYLDTIHGHYTYEVIAAFRISADNDFKYTSLTEADSPDEVTKWVNEIAARSYIKDVDATENDKFITLSTCDYHERNGRFVVVAKQINNSDDYQVNYITLDEYLSTKKGEK